ncbi:MAG: TIGR02452 family protein [Acidobacteria bacterium]|nr:TIGR02452 family protein [Acidobacteriota bacterium]MCB9399668.1 TIGR02452 family protein [Acidobacteriota bacterium]
MNSGKANRASRVAIALQTNEILKTGSYSLDGRTIDLASDLSQMDEGTRLYRPGTLEKLLKDLGPSPVPQETAIAVVNQTTFAAAHDLIKAGRPDPLCLNFASAKNPGGGFLNGAQAQEECLARASGLYRSLLLAPDYYAENRGQTSLLYSHHCIYSPKVPVFRNDSDQLLAEPFGVSIVTAPAPNAGAIRQNQPELISEIEPTFIQRIRFVLAIARENQHQNLVLGAWGCGVFANDPLWVANAFRQVLAESAFKGVFQKVVFAVLDHRPGTPTFNAFNTAFS